MPEVGAKIDRGAQIIIGALFFLSGCGSVVAGDIMVLSYQSIKKIISGAKPMIKSSVPLEDHIQPGSLDLPISNRCYRISVSSSPENGQSIERLLERFRLYDFEIKPDGALLERGMTYVLPLLVDFELTDNFRAIFSSKSTTGRNGLFARNMSDANSAMDITIHGYCGKLYVEVSPMRFHTTIYPYMPLTQARFVDVSAKQLSNEEITILHAEHGIVRDENGKPSTAVISDGALYLHLNLKGSRAGYESIFNPEMSVHLGKKEVDDRENFWRPIRLTSYGDTILEPGTFYLLYTNERIFVPPNVCAFMEDYSASIGEFSSHEAGFFDSNFGVGGGTHGVLEVHPTRMPIRFWHNRQVCRMVFYKMDEIPEKLYEPATNHYVGAGPSLGKNYKEYWKW